MNCPVARPIASSRKERKAARLADISPVRGAKDQPSAESPKRLSARGLADLERTLTPADRTLLCFVGSLRVVTGRQLVRQFFTPGVPASERAARRQLKRLSDARVLDRLPRSIGGVRAGSSGYIYSVGPVGRRLLARAGGRTARLQAPGDRVLRHTLAVADVVVSLFEASRDGDIDVVSVQTEPECWRGFTVATGGRVTVKPDLFARIGLGSVEDRLFIEVDLGTESPNTIAGKAAVYLRHVRSGAEQREHGVYPRVVFAALDPARVEQIRAALPAAPAGLFVVCLLDELIPFVTAEVSG
jgi:hypothetical protein